MQWCSSSDSSPCYPDAASAPMDNLRQLIHFVSIRIPCWIQCHRPHAVRPHACRTRAPARPNAPRRLPRRVPPNRPAVLSSLDLVDRPGSSRRRGNIFYWRTEWRTLFRPIRKLTISEWWFQVSRVKYARTSQVARCFRNLYLILSRFFLGYSEFNRNQKFFFCLLLGSPNNEMILFVARILNLCVRIGQRSDWFWIPATTKNFHCSNIWVFTFLV